MEKEQTIVSKQKQIENLRLTAEQGPQQSQGKVQGLEHCSVPSFRETT
jgi:hypothetical protein